MTKLLPRIKPFAAALSLVCAGVMSVLVASPVHAAPDCGGPIEITRGGTYSGCYQSTDAETSAVTIATTAPVTLDRATISHKGEGITGDGHAQLTVKNSKFLALSTGSQIADQRHIYLYKPVSLRVENNSMVDGHGILINADWSPVSRVTVRYNTATNLGRHAADDYIQFLQLDKVVAGSAEIAWNRVTNVKGQSSVEDIISLHSSFGRDAAHPIDIHHNMLSGAYPLTGNGFGYSGGGIMVGDGGRGNHVRVHHNRIVSSANYGVSIVGGYDNHAFSNRLASDGRDETGARVSATFSQGLALWDIEESGSMTNVDQRDNVVGWVRPDGRADWWLPACMPSGACTGNVSMPGEITAATEKAEQTAWASEIKASRFTVGTNW